MKIRGNELLSYLLQGEKELKKKKGVKLKPHNVNITDLEPSLESLWLLEGFSIELTILTSLDIEDWSALNIVLL